MSVTVRLTCCVWLAGCAVDHTGLGPPVDVGGPIDAASHDAETDVRRPLDSMVARDGRVMRDVPAPPDVPPCSPDGPFCASDTFQVCTGGDITERVVCPLGCHDVEPRCNGMTVTNVSDEHLSVGSANIIVGPSESAVFNTETGEITIDGAVVREAGEEFADGIRFARLEQDGSDVRLGVFSVASLQVAVEGEIGATGNSALIILAAGAVNIDGVVDLGGTRQEGGPGGGRGGQDGDGSGAGNGGHSRNSFDAGGGGGGGHAAPGGEGGSESGIDGHPGEAIDDPLGVPLLGGGGGGGGGMSIGASGGAGGGGGGAIQISSAVSINVAGIVRVPGGGGAEGDRAGGGGGAGGTILLEAPNINITGRTVANGGSGAAGRGGEDGARGSDNALPTSGAGGDGGGGDVPGGLDGANDPSNSDNSNGAAGGGGGAGRVVIRARRRSLRGLTSPTFGNGSSETDIEVR